MLFLAALQRLARIFRLDPGQRRPRHPKLLLLRRPLRRMYLGCWGVAHMFTSRYIIADGVPTRGEAVRREQQSLRTMMDNLASLEEPLLTDEELSAAIRAARTERRAKRAPSA